MDNFSADLRNIATAIGNLAPKENEINLLDMYPIGSVYFSVEDNNPSLLFGGTWEKIGSKLAVRENVFGNGIAIGLTGNWTGTGALGTSSAGNETLQIVNSLGGAVGTNGSNKGNQSSSAYYRRVGVPTKEQLGVNPEYSGLIIDTETIYSYKRTA